MLYTMYMTDVTLFGDRMFSSISFSIHPLMIYVDNVRQGFVKHVTVQVDSFYSYFHYLG